MNLFKRFFYGLLLSNLLLFLMPQTVFATTTIIDLINSENDVVPYADLIDWQYKLINNVLYRRLYNYTTKTPVSDWEVAP